MTKYSLPWFALITLIVAYAGLWQAAAAAPPTILVMGDSLSAAYGIATEDGWVSLLERRLVERGYDYRVVNASVSGETSSGGLARLPHALEEYEPQIVVIELGANDGLRGIHPDHTHHNLTRLIKLSQDHGAKVLLTGVRLPSNYGDAFRQLHYAVYSSAAEQTGVPLVPFLLAGAVKDPALMQEDGLHPTAEAQPLILDNVWAKLRPVLD